jgi:formylglycine-generating enzyme required for sulfatase activity
VFDSGIGRPRRPGGHPAGASAHGVLDLAGNVQEWVSTRFGPYPAEDRLPARGELGVVRGGSFLHGPNELRCSYRQPMLAGARDHYVGFRVAAGPEPSQVPFEWIDIPGGVVALGRDTTASLGPALGNEIPIHLVELEAIELGLTPVTNAQYAAFVAETGAEAPAGWPQGSPPAGREDHPVAFVDWFDARAFCAWGGGRLPTEAEWEKAARGIDGRLYPWGAADEPARAHIGAGLKEGTTASVAAHPNGAGPYGLLDLVGNVWEWVSSAYRPYPYDPTDGREDPGGSEERVLRGGSFASRDLSFTRSATRSHSSPRRRQSHIGFRIARDGRS